MDPNHTLPSRIAIGVSTHSHAPIFLIYRANLPTIWVSFGRHTPIHHHIRQRHSPARHCLMRTCVLDHCDQHRSRHLHFQLRDQCRHKAWFPVLVCTSMGPPAPHLNVPLSALICLGSAPRPRSKMTLSHVSGPNVPQPTSRLRDQQYTSCKSCSSLSTLS
jgi:hypothetical protein